MSWSVCAATTEYLTEVNLQKPEIYLLTVMETKKSRIREAASEEDRLAAASHPRR